MSIEIDILNGKARGPSPNRCSTRSGRLKPSRSCPGHGIAAAHAELRVLVEDELEGSSAMSASIAARPPGMGTRSRSAGSAASPPAQDSARHGYASIALNAAIQTLKDEGATDFALLFCEPHIAPF